MLTPFAILTAANDISREYYPPPPKWNEQRNEIGAGDGGTEGNFRGKATRFTYDVRAYIINEETKQRFFHSI